MAKPRTKRTTPQSGHVASVRAIRKSVEVEFVIPETPPTSLYANHLVVQSDGRATYLSFFLSQPPFLLGDEETVKKKLEDMKSLKAHMVAQIIVPQDRMQAFMKVLTQNTEASNEVPPLLSGGNQLIVQ